MPRSPACPSLLSAFMYQHDPNPCGTKNWLIASSSLDLRGYKTHIMHSITASTQPLPPLPLILEGAECCVARTNVPPIDSPNGCVRFRRANPLQALEGLWHGGCSPDMVSLFAKEMLEQVVLRGQGGCGEKCCIMRTTLKVVFRCVSRANHVQRADCCFLLL